MADRSTRRHHLASVGRTPKDGVPSGTRFGELRTSVARDQPPRFRLDDVQAAERGVLLRLGKEPIAMVEPVACLLSALVREPHGGAVTAATRTPWLFPGKVGQHLDNERLRRRLRDLH